MDLSDYVQIEGAVVDRLDHLRRTRGVARSEGDPISAVAKVLQVAAVLRAKPLDRSIDYVADCVPDQR